MSAPRARATGGGGALGAGGRRGPGAAGAACLGEGQEGGCGWRGMSRLGGKTSVGGLRGTDSTRVGGLRWWRGGGVALRVRFGEPGIPLWLWREPRRAWGELHAPHVSDPAPAPPRPAGAAKRRHVVSTPVRLPRVRPAFWLVPGGRERLAWSLRSPEGFMEEGGAQELNL